MGCCKNVSKNQFYILKKLDFFSFDVKLRLQRSKEGGVSDDKIGSWFGVVVSLAIILGVTSFISTKFEDIHNYSNTIYNTIEMKNKFSLTDKGDNIFNSGDIQIDEYTFLPSIDHKLLSMRDIEDQEYSELFIFNEDKTDYTFDLEKLNTYVKFYIKIVHQGSKVENKILRSDMVPCTREMFRNLNQTDLTDFKINKRLCPDIEKLKDQLRVKNSYSNKEERISFSIQAVNCDNSTGDCQEFSIIEKFFDNMFFTVYVLEENIEFGDVANIGKKPLSTTDTFHSQFILNQISYRDNNNFIKFNHATTLDDKYGMQPEEQFGFINVNIKPFFSSKASIEYDTVTLLDGSQVETQDSVILGLYFFVDDYRIEHTRQVYTIVQALSETGGIATSLIAGLGFFASLVNYYVYVMHFVHLLYFVRDDEASEFSGFLSKSFNSRNKQDQDSDKKSINQSHVSEYNTIFKEGGDEEKKEEQKIQDSKTYDSTNLNLLQAAEDQNQNAQTQAPEKKDSPDLLMYEKSPSTMMAPKFEIQKADEESLNVTQQLTHENSSAKIVTAEQSTQIQFKPSKNEVKLAETALNKGKSGQDSNESGIYDGNSKRFIHRELSFLDIFANLKFNIYLIWYKLVRREPENKAHELAMLNLSRTEVLFKKGLHVFEDEICVESILRSIHKLQASMAAVVENDEEKIKNAKTMYFANQIIYRSVENEKKMRFTTEFLDFLRFSVADTIYYDHDGGDGHGEFTVKSKRTCDSHHFDKKDNFSMTKLNISQKLRSNQSAF